MKLLHGPLSRTSLTWSLVTLSTVLAACTLRPPMSSEEHMVDSASLSPELAQGVVATPFCLHLRYSNQFFVAYSDARTEAWITDGTCATNGARRAVDSLRLSWRDDWYDTQNTRQCLQTDACRINEQNVIEGHNVRCASAQARAGNQTAFVSTDQARCY